MDEDNGHAGVPVLLLHQFLSTRYDIDLITLKDDEVTRTMPIYKPAFDETTSFLGDYRSMVPDEHLMRRVLRRLAKGYPARVEISLFADIDTPEGHRALFYPAEKGLVGKRFGLA